MQVLGLPLHDSLAPTLLLFPFDHRYLSAQVNNVLHQIIDHCQTAILTIETLSRTILTKPVRQFGSYEQKIYWNT